MTPRELAGHGAAVVRALVRLGALGCDPEVIEAVDALCRLGEEGSVMRVALTLRFECRLAGGDGEGEAWEAVDAGTAQSAAERYAERYDARAVEFPDERRVEVRGPAGASEVFRVTLTTAPVYNARRVA